jgi:hypothetical protein
MHRAFLGLIILQLAASLACAELTTVSGKVAVESEGAAGIRVSAWPLATRSFAGEAPRISDPSAADGSFSLKVEPGEYYFIADGKKHFGYYGRNPLNVAPGGYPDLKLNLSLKKTAESEVEPFVETGVLARASLNGEPLSGVVLAVYTDLTSQLKGLGFGMSAPSEAAGDIEVPLSPGTYYLVARKRNSGQHSGPLRAGDFFGYYAGNPLIVKEGEVARIGIDMLEVPQKVERLADKMFGQTSVRGRILNAVGSPVSGVRVLLYSDDTMLNRPLYVSQPSNAKGEYVLSFPKGGAYFLAARDKLGGAPGPGELYGRYTGSQDSSIRIKAGQALTGVDLLVEEMW